ncbi:MAG: LacI family DNA-binding transcriptional regulator [Alphaproteobacteria bacterium]|nr:LacI family DNA-binding transcriptional regulator [Alphaproteobacteria bacterium]
MPTIKDVANLAGVSVGTVSRVLAKNDTVKPKLQLKVEQAVKQLRYKPNAVARALRKNSTDVIGLIVPDITNPFFAELAKYTEMEAAKRGLSVMLANTHGDPAFQTQQLDILLDRSPLGVLVVSAANADTKPLDTEIPIIAIDRDFADYPCIATDHEASAKLAAVYLLELGHRKIGYAAGPENTQVAQTREAGFLAGIAETAKRMNIEPDIEILRGAFDFHTGESLGKAFLDRSPSDRPSAIATASDQQAIGIMRVARDLNISIPDDLSVIGFDDIPLAALVTPRLSTIRQSVPEIAKAAIDAMTKQDHNINIPSFPGQLILRGSCKQRT